MENQITIVKLSRKPMLRPFGSSFTPITREIFSPIRKMRIENTSLTMSNIVRIFRRFTTDRRIDASTCFFTEPVRT